MQPLGFVSAQESEDESGLKQVHIISGQLNSCRDVLNQASSDIVSCHFIFFTGLKSFLLMICLDSFGRPQSRCLKLQEEGLVALRSLYLHQAPKQHGSGG